jgi:hypothetical protein
MVTNILKKKLFKPTVKNNLLHQTIQTMRNNRSEDPLLYRFNVLQA